MENTKYVRYCNLAMLSENQKLIEEYFSYRVISEGTKGVYYKALLSWDRNTQKPLTQLTEQPLKLWYQKVSVELHKTTIEKYAAQLRTLYAHVLEQSGLSKRRAKADAAELFDIIPFKDLRQRAKKEANLRDKLVTPAEFNAIMDLANSPRMRALLSITYESGCRKGEIFSLRLKDIQVHDEYWTLSVEGKTGTRTIPIMNSIPQLRAWIQQHPDRENDNSKLFVTGKDRPMSPGSFNTGLQLLCKKAGIRMLYPHQLRHTRLTELAEDGLGDTQLRSFAGWTPASAMASRYVHLSGRGHMNAVLETQGIDTGSGSKAQSQPLIELQRCPNCDQPIDPKWVQCPACQFILDDKMGIQKHDRITELEAKLDKIMQIVEEKERHETS